MEEIKNSTVPLELLKSINERRVIPFIGSGFSMPSGLPNWATLVERLILSSPKVAGLITPEIKSELTQIDLAELIDSLNVSSVKTYEVISESVNNVDIEPNEYHELISKLPFDTIITTNWDTLIEQELHRAKIPYNVIYNNEDVVFYRPDKKVQVLKIHGTITSNSSLVFSKAHYSEYWTKNNLLRALLTTLLCTRNFLFMGYGLGDPNIIQLLSMLKEAGGKMKPQNYILSYSKTSELSRMFEITNVQAPGFEGENYDESTIDFLKELVAFNKTDNLTNYQRSLLVNDQLSALVKGKLPKKNIYFRGTLGWLSNPVPLKENVIYGSHDQDLAERRMTELIGSFLSNSRFNKVYNILNLRGARHVLSGKFSTENIIRRLKSILEMISRFGDQIVIAVDDTPRNLNQMIFDKNCYLIGHKHESDIGIKRVTLSNNREVILSEIVNYNKDFDELLSRNLSEAEHKGVDVTKKDWSNRFIELEIGSIIQSLEQSVSTASHNEDASELILPEALMFAIENHNRIDQKRDDNSTPYYIHILRVVEKLRTIGGVSNYEVLSAAALHDVIEDCNVESHTITTTFGKRVSNIVEELTQKTNQSDKAYFDQIKNSNLEAKTIKLADKLDNVCELRNKGYELYGGYTPTEYLANAETILNACEHSNVALESALRIEIDLARKEFE